MSSRTPKAPPVPPKNWFTARVRRRVVPERRAGRCPRCGGALALVGGAWKCKEECQ